MGGDVGRLTDHAPATDSPFELTERDGRWYGRGASDCKGNIVAHLTALRALGDDRRVGVKLIAEGSEEQGTGGLEQFVPEHAGLLDADAIIVADTGNFALAVPTLTTTLRGLVNVVVRVCALESAMHSGMFGGAAPDALLALIRMLATLRDAQGDKLWLTPGRWITLAADATRALARPAGPARRARTPRAAAPRRARWPQRRARHPG